MIERLLLDVCWEFAGSILLIAELRDVTCIADGLLDTVGGKAERRARGGDHIFFDHDATHVICAGMEADLGGLFAHCEP